LKLTQGAKLLKRLCEAFEAEEFSRDVDEFSNHADGLEDIVMVAHYGNRFDVPFLFHAWNTHGINFSSIPFKGQIDTLTLAKRSQEVMPQNYKL